VFFSIANFVSNRPIYIYIYIYTHSIVTSKNERWPRLIWPTLYSAAGDVFAAIATENLTKEIDAVGCINLLVALIIV